MSDETTVEEAAERSAPEVLRVPARTSAIGMTLSVVTFGVTVLAAGIIASLQKQNGPPQLLFLIPMPAIVGLVIYGMFAAHRRSAVFRSIAQHARTPDLAEARRKDTDVFCAGRLRCSEPVTAPHLHSPCAAYVARERSAQRKVSTVSCVAACELETEDHGTIPLHPGPWEVYDPFDAEVLEGVATVRDGTEVIVRARVDERMAHGEGYRGSKVLYSLKADNGFLAPLSGHFSEKESTLGTGPFVLPVIITMGVTAVATFLMIARGQQQRAALVAETASTAEVAVEDRCDQTLKCTEGRLCDVETMTCAKAITGRVLEGEPCTARGQCAAGSRCAGSLFDEVNEPKCRRACMTDAQCGTGWCVPCGDVKRTVPGECVDPAKMGGAIGVMCDLAHGSPPGPPRTKAGSSGAIAPSAPSAP